MTKKNMIAFVLGFGLIAAMSCKNATQPTPPPIKPLELIQPKGGGHYKVGDTVLITWKINSAEVSLVNVWLLPVWPVNPLRNSFPPETTSYKWTIDSTDTSSSCYIKVSEYNNSVPPDSSGKFSITLN